MRRPSVVQPSVRLTPNSQGRTPLHYAVEMEARDISVILLKNGADRDAKMTEDPFISPQKLASKIGSREIKTVFSQSCESRRFRPLSSRRLTGPAWYDDHSYSAFVRPDLQAIEESPPLLVRRRGKDPSARPTHSSQSAAEEGRRGTARPLPPPPVRTRRFTRTESELTAPNQPFRRMGEIRPRRGRRPTRRRIRNVLHPTVGAPVVAHGRELSEFAHPAVLAASAGRRGPPPRRRCAL